MTKPKKHTPPPIPHFDTFLFWALFSSAIVIITTRRRLKAERKASSIERLAGFIPNFWGFELLGWFVGLCLSSQLAIFLGLLLCVYSHNTYSSVLFRERLGNGNFTLLVLTLSRMQKPFRVSVVEDLLSKVLLFCSVFSSFSDYSSLFHSRTTLRVSPISRAKIDRAILGFEALRRATSTNEATGGASAQCPSDNQPFPNFWVRPFQIQTAFNIIILLPVLPYIRRKTYNLQPRRTKTSRVLPSIIMANGFPRGLRPDQ